jgi:hypothetical protein
MKKEAIVSADLAHRLLQIPRMHGHNSPERYGDLAERLMAKAERSTGMRGHVYNALALRAAHLNLRASGMPKAEWAGKLNQAKHELRGMIRETQAANTIPNNATSEHVANPSFFSRNKLPIGLGLAAGAAAATGGLISLRHFMNQKKRNKPEDELQPENKVASK